MAISKIEEDIRRSLGKIMFKKGAEEPPFYRGCLDLKVYSQYLNPTDLTLVYLACTELKDRGEPTKLGSCLTNLVAEIYSLQQEMTEHICSQDFEAAAEGRQRVIDALVTATNTLKTKGSH